MRTRITLFTCYEALIVLGQYGGYLTQIFTLKYLQIYADYINVHQNYRFSEEITAVKEVGWETGRNMLRLTGLEQL